MKNLLLVVSAIAFFTGVESGCTFDPLPACAKRDFSRNYVQYTGNPCDSSTFYQCERRKTGLVAFLQPCPVCLDWSDDTWTCSIRNTERCPTEAPITEVIAVQNSYCIITGNGPDGPYTQTKREGADHVSYYVKVFDTEVLMPCPPGTYFDFKQCKCIFCVPGGPCAGSSPLVFTLDFDSKGSEKGIYYDVDSSAVLSPNPGFGLSLKLDGQATNIEVPFFQNNEFSQFKFTGSFKRDSSAGQGEQGILFNGASPQVDCWPASIYVISTGLNTLKAGIQTQDGVFEINNNNNLVAADKWNDIVLRYTGSTLDFTVNGLTVSKNATGTTLRTKCNLLFGESYDASGLGHFFKGELDTLSWYREP